MQLFQQTTSNLSHIIKKFLHAIFIKIILGKLLGIYVPAMRLSIFLIFLIASTLAYSQDEVFNFEEETQLNELLEILNKNPDPAILEKLCYDLEFLTLHSQIPLNRLKFYLTQTRKIAHQHKTLIKLEYRIYYISGMLDYLLGDSLEFIKKTEEIRKELKSKADYEALVSMNIAISGFYGYKLKPHLALRGYLENEEILTKTLKKELENKAIPQCISNANNLGFLYQQLKQPDSAIYYFSIGLKRAIDYKDEVWIGIISGNIGTCYIEQGNFNLAEPLLIKDMDLSLKKINTLLQ